MRGLPRLPPEIRRATAFGVMGTLALIVWHSAGGNAARPLFDVAGPLLCLAFAAALTDAPAAPPPAAVVHSQL